jgi:hypothetical protein
VPVATHRPARKPYVLPYSLARVSVLLVLPVNLPSALKLSIFSTVRSIPCTKAFIAHTPSNGFFSAAYPASTVGLGVSSLLLFTSLVVLNTTFPIASKKSTRACPMYSLPDSDKTKVSWTRRYPVTRPAFHITE